MAIGQLKSVTGSILFLPSACWQECDNLWWDAFTTEFFEDDAMLTITFCLEDGPKRYSKNPGSASFMSLSCMHHSEASLDLIRLESFIEIVHCTMKFCSVLVSPFEAQ